MPPPYPIESGVANVNGTSLAYDCAGTGSPMVLVHGFSLDRRMWDDQVEAFAATHTVLRYDLRGFGRSALPEPDMPFSHADDLAALMDELGLGPAIVVGQSFGGWMAVEFALAHADRLRALVLVDAVAPGIELSAEWDALADRIYGAARGESLDAGKRRWLEHPMLARSRALPAVAARLRTMVGDWSVW